MPTKPREIRPVPEIIRRLAQQGLLRLSDKAESCVATTMLDVEDIENAIIEGRLVKRERDETGQVRWKYTIIGPAHSGRPVYCAGKVITTGGGVRYFVLTAHWADQR